MTKEELLTENGKVGIRKGMKELPVPSKTSIVSYNDYFYFASPDKPLTRIHKDNI